MAVISLICAQCGGQMEVDDNKPDLGCCKHCGAKVILKDEIINQTFNYQTTIVKNISGLDKSDADEMVLNAETLMSLEEWQKAENVLQKASELFPKDWRIWFCLVKCKTEGFKNYSDLTHKPHFERAQKIAKKEDLKLINDTYQIYLNNIEAERKKAASLKEKERQTILAQLEQEQFAKKKKRLRNVILSIASVSAVIIITVSILLGIFINDNIRASNVDKLISKIGTVTYQSKPAIDAAEEAYGKLSGKQKEKVQNYNKIDEAKKSFKVVYTIYLIDSIGIVTVNSKDIIFEIEERYSNLTAGQKSLITNYSSKFLEVLYEFNPVYTVYLIENLGQISLSSLNSINLINEYLNNLDEEQLSKITNYKNFEAALTEYNQILFISKVTINNAGGITNLSVKIAGVLVIPPIINGITVTSINSEVFKDFTELTSVTIPDTVKAIGDNAFAGCTNLTIYCNFEEGSKEMDFGKNWHGGRDVKYLGEWQ